MNYESRIADLREELLAIKAAFARSAADLIVYEYSINFQVTSSTQTFTLTFISDDGTDTIASVYIKNGLGSSRRIPYSGGARWYLFSYLQLGETPPASRTVTVYSIRKGKLQIS